MTRALLDSGAEPPIPPVSLPLLIPTKKAAQMAAFGCIQLVDAII
jgi:hypothetical protein